MADNYVCTLDEASIQKAKKELNEDPADRLAAVEALRKLLKEKNPHIKCPTDTRFLLHFLRTRKFSQLEAVLLIERFLTKRTEINSWFGDIDPKDPAIQELYDCGAWIAPKVRNKEGRRVFIIRPSCINPKTVHKPTFFRALACFLYYIYIDESAQVNGTSSIFDATGFSLFHQHFIAIDEQKKMMSMWQKAFPARIKAFNLYNMGTFMDYMLMIMKLTMSEKIQKRIKLHSSLESVYEIIPYECLPEEYLPDDYTGPNAGTEREIIEAMKKDMTSGDIYERIKTYSSSQWTVDKSKKPTDIPQASFRKLAVE